MRYTVLFIVLLILSCSSNEPLDTELINQKENKNIEIEEEEEEEEEEELTPNETIENTATEETEEELPVIEEPLDTVTVEKKIQVVLLAGQSNMSGHGNYDALDVAIQDRISKASTSVTLNFNRKEPQPLSYYDSNSVIYDFNKYFGPELLAGVILSEKYPDREFLFIKLSAGGASLYGAWNSNWSLEKASQMEESHSWYTSHVNYIRESLSILDQQEKTYEIIGLLWFQGEQDGTKDFAANTYLENLTELIKAYRNDLEVENMPIVIGQINSTYGIEGGPAIIRNAMTDYVLGDPYARLIKTNEGPNWSDYPKHPDNTHYNTEGQKRFGEAFGEKLIELIE